MELQYVQQNEDFNQFEMPLPYVGQPCITKSLLCFSLTSSTTIAIDLESRKDRTTLIMNLQGQTCLSKAIKLRAYQIGEANKDINILNHFYFQNVVTIFKPEEPGNELYDV